VRKGLARQRAYELVQRAALAAQEGQGEFRALLAADAEVAARLDAGELAACFDLRHHLRYVDHVFERVFGPRAGEAR
jgi:adenylosuccinate lyase